MEYDIDATNIYTQTNVSQNTNAPPTGAIAGTKQLVARNSSMPP